MMTLPIFQIDAFTKGPFSGNPAAVCPLDSWLSDDILQKIAESNNLSETAFFVKEEEGYHIRWFTPNTEVDLCGHATLASGYVLFNELGVTEEIINFKCRSGHISIKKNDDLLTLNFPIDTIHEVPCPPEFIKSIDRAPIKSYKGKSDYLLIYEAQEHLEEMKPDFNLMSQVESRGCLVSSPGKDYDIVCRGFFPRTAVNEDPATGSAQTTLAAYWPGVIGQTKYTACQLSNRKGYFKTEIDENRVHISGACSLFLRGEIVL